MRLASESAASNRLTSCVIRIDGALRVERQSVTGILAERIALGNASECAMDSIVAGSRPVVVNRISAECRSYTGNDAVLTGPRDDIARDDARSPCIDSDRAGERYGVALDDAGGADRNSAEIFAVDRVVPDDARAADLSSDGLRLRGGLAPPPVR